MRVLCVKFIVSVLLILSTTSFNLQGQTQSQAGNWSISCDKTCKASQLLFSEDKKPRYSATLSLTEVQDLL